MFMIIICILIVPILAILARMAGGGLGAKYLDKKGVKEGRMPFNMTLLPEILFSIPLGVLGGFISSKYVTLLLSLFGLTLSSNIILTVSIVLSILWVLLWFNTGHGAILHWGKEEIRDPDRKQTLTPVVDILAKILRVEKNSTDYCRLFMSVKGLLIGLPFGGFILGLLWPVAYEIGVDLRGKTKYDPHGIAELISGMFAGIAFILSVVFIL